MSIKSKKGFTIIEVVLVLAIAGLIFLMVFIALPNMQRSQRDTARRNDYAAFASNITNYLTNNNGSLPANCAASITDNAITGTGKNVCNQPEKYVNTDGIDSAGKVYKISVKAYATNLAMNEMTKGDNPEIWLVKNAKCGDSQGTVTSSGGNRDYAVLGQLESGIFCQDNV